MGFLSSPFSDEYFPLVLRKQLSIVIFALIIVRISESAFQTTNNGPEKPGSTDLTFYKNCEGAIRQELETFPKTELAKETKVTRIRRSNGTSLFYPYRKPVKGKHYFSWTPLKHQKNLTSSSAKTLIIGIPNPGKSPFGWMLGTFFALRKIKSSGKESHYYVMVVYARKDADRILLEWDRWSPSFGKGLDGRNALVEAVDYTAIITRNAILCAYGTCSCEACKTCKTDDAAEDFKDAWMDPHRIKASGTSSIEGETFNNNMMKDVDMYFANEKTRSTQADSNAYASARSRAADGDGKSKATANTDKGSGFAEAISSKGGSVAASKGEVDSVADAKSVSGQARALSMANQGFAQSNAETSDGEVEAIAVKSGAGDAKDYDNYDDIEEVDDDDEEMDAEMLYNETDTSFALAAKRTHFTRLASKGGISADMCEREDNMVTQMDKLELAALLKGAVGEETNKRVRKLNRIAMRKALLYKDPLRFGIDVDGSVNTSVLMCESISGYAIKPKTCCKLTAEEGTEIWLLLKVLGQECGGLLQKQVTRLEGYQFGQVRKLMQTKKLTRTQNRDLTPILLLRTCQDKEKLTDTVQQINTLFSNATSDKITLNSAILVNAAQYIASKAKPHRVKAIGGMIENAHSVWTGVLLEYKKCLENEPSCTEEQKDKLEIEMNLVLGTYLFLKHSDNRYSALISDASDNPGDTFVRFMKLHNLEISKQVYCKTKRLTGKT